MNNSLIARQEPGWYRDAIFNEVYVRGFYDSNMDGNGDFRGLTERLDYLQWLGVDCIWLLPMYASPLRDGGYDISDYYAVLLSTGRSKSSGYFWTPRIREVCV